MSRSGTGRALRADAQRNRDALVAAARKVFARNGTEAPLEDVARLAGVGQGTLYRHFPTRDHLFAAILADQVDMLEREAADVSESPDPGSALRNWLRLYDESSSSYRGLSAYLASRLADEDDSPMATACAPMKARFGELFERARSQGAVRGDVTPAQVLALVGGLPKGPADGRTPEPLLDIVLNGLAPEWAP